ncbi:proton-coupled zinc antiporter SLC30A2-like [Mercenaria mercenaria]|uniref:proton-coupled zinc antiporter SLC30A2-like n=1 Tax=Mercenaria mercenaria TaxID=6596 RepID=UPI00234F9290|nr:proton-coupled zinc antiporter SLC30A2-like [Mercenaria mercenaria]
MADDEAAVKFPAAPQKDTMSHLAEGRRRCSSCSGGIHDETKVLTGYESLQQVQETLPSPERHCHESKTRPDIDKRARRKLLIACVLSLTFMIAEVIGGIFAHSLAIVSDAAHLLTDLASFLISLLALYLASRRATKKLSFGWYRAEILGALVSILFLWVITGVLCYMAVERVVSMDFEVNATVMLITAACGVAFNLLMGDSLATEVKGHSHKANINVKAAFIHVLGDLLQSVGVLVAAFIIYFKPSWKLADPICTFVFSVIVLGTTLTIMRDILVVLMEGTPRSVNFKAIYRSLKDIPEVKDIHDLRIWSLSMDKVALSVHLAVSRTTNTLEVLEQASCMIRYKFGITETTIQIEEHVADMLDCTHCRDLPD